jgi:nucleoside-diphosphate-sugar epimerase
VRAVVRPGNARPLPPGVESVEASLDASGVGALARAFEFSSAIVHAAGMTRGRHESAFQAINVAGTRAVVEAANDAGARLLLISSQAAVGPGTPVRPSREDDEPRPVNAYGRSKLAAEVVVRTAARVPWTILRPSMVYGPRDRQFLPLFRLASRGISPLVTDPSTSFTFIYVDDAVRAVLAAAEHQGAVGQTLFLGHPDVESAADVLRYMAAAFERPYRPRRLPLAVVRAASVAGDLAWLLGWQPPVDRHRLVELTAEGFVCAVERARQALGFTASTALPEGVARTAQWYRARGWI